MSLLPEASYGLSTERKSPQGAVRKVRLPRGFLEVMQVVEYLRAFLVGRQGWAEFNMLLIISGAFGVFRRELCRQIGGFRTSTVGEDLDLVVRMHRHLREKNEEYRVGFVPDPFVGLRCRVHEVVGAAASPLAKRLGRRALAESRHAVQSPLRPNRFSGIALPLALRVYCTHHGRSWVGEP